MLIIGPVHYQCWDTDSRQDMFHINSIVHSHQCDCSRRAGTEAFPASKVTEIGWIPSFVGSKVPRYFTSTPNTFEIRDPLLEEVLRKASAPSKTSVYPNSPDALWVGCGEQQA